jgi:DNA replication protein DnaC
MDQLTNNQISSIYAYWRRRERLYRELGKTQDQSIKTTIKQLDAEYDYMIINDFGLRFLDRNVGEELFNLINNGPVWNV